MIPMGMFTPRNAFTFSTEIGSHGFLDCLPSFTCSWYNLDWKVICSNSSVGKNSEMI